MVAELNTNFADDDMMMLPTPDSVESAAKSDVFTVSVLLFAMTRVLPGASMTRVDIKVAEATRSCPPLRVKKEKS